MCISVYRRWRSGEWGIRRVSFAMLMRIVSACVLVPITLAVVFFAPPLLYLAILGIIGSLCLNEYFQIMEKSGWRGQPWFGYAAFWLLLFGLWWLKIPPVVLFTGLSTTAFLASMWRRVPIRERVQGLMVDLVGVLYLTLSFFSAQSVRFSFGVRAGLEWTITLLAVTWVGDTAALFAGKAFGRTPFARLLSPKKTWEGALGGLLAGMGAGLLLHHFFFTSLALHHVLAASLLICVSGQLGDLAESMLKRAAEVKESSHLIPGHGGVLDRVDSLLFAFPVLYIYLQQIYS
jgi:phosphatidate cytidylyltransferase